MGESSRFWYNNMMYYHDCLNECAKHSDKSETAKEWLKMYYNAMIEYHRAVDREKTA